MIQFSIGHLTVGPEPPIPIIIFLFLLNINNEIVQSDLRNKIKEKLKDPKNKIPQDLLKKLGKVLK